MHGEAGGGGRGHGDGEVGPVVAPVVREPQLAAVDLQGLDGLFGTGDGELSGAGGLGVGDLGRNIDFQAVAAGPVYLAGGLRTAVGPGVAAPVSPVPVAVGAAAVPVAVSAPTPGARGEPVGPAAGH